MEKRNYYYLREIILGLREEYLKNKISLENLKKHIIIDDKKINNIDFKIFKDKENRLSLFCYLEKRQNVINKLFNSLNNIDDMGYIIEILKDSEYYGIKPMEGIKVDNLLEFRKESEKIINSDFNKNIQLQLFDLMSADRNYDLLINAHKIEVKCYNKLVSDISYLQNKDVITVSAVSVGKNSNISIHRALNLEVPKDLLNDYYIDLIDSTPIAFKNVYIEPYMNSLESIELNISENNSGVVLKKINKIVD